MDKLFLIPARGGSKGIPGKNIKLLNGKPLIHYTIDLARKFSGDENICLSTDDEGIIQCAAEVSLAVPFIRPAELSGDHASMDGVLMHAIKFYGELQKIPSQIVLLQPTSPLRQMLHLKEALDLYSDDLEMIVSVCKSKANPYYNLFEEDEAGMLHICKGAGNIATRQEAPPVYIYNGSIYIINTNAFISGGSLGKLRKISKYEMDEKFSLDIDDDHDWQSAEMFFRG